VLRGGFVEAALPIGAAAPFELAGSILRPALSGRPTQLGRRDVAETAAVTAPPPCWSTAERGRSPQLVVAQDAP
jgi:hypothetical protein